MEFSDVSIIEKEEEASIKDNLLKGIKRSAKYVSSYVGIPAYKRDADYNNQNYIQGIEKFVDAMRGKRYTAIIIAKNQIPTTVNELRMAYENVYSQLSPMATTQLAYSTNESLAQSLTRSRGVTETVNRSVSIGTTQTTTTTESDSISETKGTNWSEGESKPNFWGRLGALSGPLMMAGVALAPFTAGASLFVASGVSGVAGIASAVGSKTKTKSRGGSESETKSHSISQGESYGTSHTETEGTSYSDSVTDSEGNTATVGETKNFTITTHDKYVEDLLKRIDKHLERIDNAEANGLWSANAYFLSYDEKYISQSAAAIFRSIMQGDDSYVETSAINSWNVSDKNDGRRIVESICGISMPLFVYKEIEGQKVIVDGSALVSTNELAMMMGLPRKSVPGLPVVEHISLGKEVVRHSDKSDSKSVELGSIFDHGQEFDINRVKLDAQSLTSHLFVTGSTGCGKSETVYKILSESQKLGVKFLIIEPAKGEYKSVFGDVNVFGANPKKSQLLRINPFKFPEGVHVLAHIDGLTEIFNVCWPMYAAMPAVLKKAILEAYKNCGWDLYNSENKNGNYFPTFLDVLNELETTIKNSAYSDEVKGNYIGSLVTRVESLTNGINGEMFSADEIDEKVLFDDNTIIDLSEIRSSETISLAMSILVMRLNEYRKSKSDEPNRQLQHLTVLEEAHNILKRVSTEQSMEGSNVVGKSVEMLINSIAEMRTYGEGFVIVDQSPTSVHGSAIKNTNTKIIMRLPDGEDRHIAGKSAAMLDDQVDEIAKLPTGVAVVYQNDWLQPVMCKVKMSDTPRVKYKSVQDTRKMISEDVTSLELLKLLLKGRMKTNVEINLEEVEKFIANTGLPSPIKIRLDKCVADYKREGMIDLWKNENMVELSHLVSRLLDMSDKVDKFLKTANSIEEINDYLKILLDNSVILPEMMLTTQQLLLRDVCEGDMEKMKVYQLWMNGLRSH